jgi:hypothetical protein
MTAQPVIATCSLHLFGAATPTGEAFRRMAASRLPHAPLHRYSRRVSPLPAALEPDGAVAFTHPADFTDPAAFQPAGGTDQPAIWVSFGPIWLLAPFLERLAREHPERLAGLRGLIACSSSSVHTKRYAANRDDRALVARLREAEEQLLATARRLAVPCSILQPTLIYGQVGPYRDRNLSRLLQLMRRLPMVPLPAHTGLRQPIHAHQLAAVALQLARQLADGAAGAPEATGSGLPERLALGGDVQLSYHAMLVALRQSRASADPARRCRLLPIPNRLLVLLAAPLALRSPKTFEAVLRMAADLAGFTAAHELLGSPPQPFPLPADAEPCLLP